VRRWIYTRCCPALLALLLLCSCANEIERERACRLAVKSLVAAPPSKVPGELARVVKHGRYALPDIEQEMHQAPAGSRLRLLDAIERIGDAEAVPLLEFVARHDTEDRVRKRARYVARTLRRARAN
jgi:hypothetical protein